MASEPKTTITTQSNSAATSLNSSAISTDSKDIEYLARCRQGSSLITSFKTSPEFTQLIQKLKDLEIDPPDIDQMLTVELCQQI